MRSPAYTRPSSPIEACRLLREADGSATPLAGGTDLIPAMQSGAIAPSLLVDLNGLDELVGVDYQNERVFVGARTSMAELTRNERLRTWAPILGEAAGWVGSAQIRTMATIGGNAVNASPVADTVPALFVLDATVHLLNSDGEEHSLPITDLATGPGTTVLEPGCLVSGFSFHPVSPSEFTWYARTSQRHQLSIAKTTLALRIELTKGIITGARIAMGAVAPQVLLANATCQFLREKPLDDDVIDEAGRILSEETNPITDARSTQFYRATVTGNLLRKGLRKLSKENP